MPNEFAQQMRVLHDISGKPLNYVIFCYTQVLWYWKLLSPKRCKHFLSLTVSMSIMLESDEWIWNAYRQTFCYVLWWPDKTFPINSVHGVIHLHEDASHLNCSLNGISCFLFENYLQQINKHVRSVRNPLEQVTRCLSETEHSEVDDTQIHPKVLDSVKERDSCFLLSKTAFVLLNRKMQTGLLLVKFCASVTLHHYFTNHVVLDIWIECA